MKKIESHRSFAGHQEVWEHQSEVLGVPMKVGIWVPDDADETTPVLYFLSGLTCTEQNFITKSGFQRIASELKVLVVAPDTSPRGEGVPNDDAYDLGQGAGFYVNATQEPWSKHFKMYDYITKELLSLVEDQFPNSGKRGIFGHSMGGHGALMLALKNPGMFQSVSAFSPIVAPTQVPWGEKAFGAYLGPDREAWKEWDTCELIKSAEERLHILVDQGADDNFLPQLQPELLKEVCEAHGHPLTLRMHPGFDHSYYFISTFIEDHFRHFGASI